MPGWSERKVSEINREKGRDPKRVEDAIEKAVDAFEASLFKKKMIVKPDIFVTTKCTGNKCPIKGYCLRFLAPHRAGRQDWFDLPPYDHSKRQCSFYISAEKPAHGHPDVIDESNT